MAMRTQLVVSLMSFLLIGCAPHSTQRSTALTVADFETIIADSALGLLRSDAINSRSQDDPPMRITFDRVTNLTTDLLTTSEQWHIVEQALRSQEVTELQQQRNVVIVIPAARAHGFAREAGEGMSRGSIVTVETEAYSERLPTHRLEATVRSATRIVDSDRAELYECVFHLTELESGEQTTVSSTLIKRAASGRLWD